jgi:hypothetical protein
MNFQPKTEQEIQDAKLWKKAEYAFEVIDATEKQSKAGKTMIELRLRLTDGRNARTISDYLLDETAGKLRHAASACGLLQKYESGSLADSDFLGKRGKLRLGVEKKKGYPERNIIADYICDGAASPGFSFFGGNGAKTS